MLDENFWKEGISFYLDGSSFPHKYNPCGQTITTRNMAWRKASEGLSVECTSKASHEGTGGKVVHFLVAISNRKGVVLCEQYLGRLNGEMFADFVHENFKRGV